MIFLIYYFCLFSELWIKIILDFYLCMIKYGILYFQIFIDDHQGPASELPRGHVRSFLASYRPDLVIPYLVGFSRGDVFN